MLRSTEAGEEDGIDMDDDKAELVEFAGQELGLSIATAEQKTVIVLRDLIRRRSATE